MTCVSITATRRVSGPTITVPGPATAFITPRSAGGRDRPVGAEADDEGGGEPGAAQTPAGLPGGNGRLGAAGGRERDRECHLSHAKSLTC
jgi:hypothetical protein